MALNKWLDDTRAGLKTNLTCRFMLIHVAISMILLMFVGVGFWVIWLAVLRLLAALAPFNDYASDALARLGLSVGNLQRMKSQGGLALWLWFGFQSLIGAAVFVGGLLIISRANFSIISLLLSALGR